MKLTTITEHFVSNLTRLSRLELQTLFNKEYKSDIKVLHSSLQKLVKGTDAVYLIVSYDVDEGEFLINDMTVISQNGKLKMYEHGSMPIATAVTLQQAKEIVTKLCK